MPKIIQNKALQKEKDRMLCESTLRCQNEPNFNEKGEKILPFSLPQIAFDKSIRKLNRPKKCYICKEHFWQVHHFYHQLCPMCANENYQKRVESVNLKGRVALVTGGRIKIGYEIALKLLRAGAKVHITTRFKHNAIHRYQQEKDFKIWAKNLHIHALDLKNIPSIEAFIEYLYAEESSLDILINNACQTIRKSDEYYAIMGEREQKYLASTQKYKIEGFFDNIQIVQANKTLSLKKKNIVYDEFNEPIDLASHNSLVSRLESISTVEMLEVQVINAIAPFMFNSQLKKLMMNSSFEKKFIINVSSMEGKFNRENKTKFHPHTNMAKASLNMMTRTSAKEYMQEDIYMNSVDTGWATQEHPFPIKIKNRAKGIVPPLDCIDGASRILAPIFDTLTQDKEVWGLFLKDYEQSEW